MHDIKASQPIVDLLAPTIDAHSRFARRVMIPVLENIRLSYVAFTARTMLYVSNTPAFCVVMEGLTAACLESDQSEYPRANIAEYAEKEQIIAECVSGAEGA